MSALMVVGTDTGKGGEGGESVTLLVYRVLGDRPRWGLESLALESLALKSPALESLATVPTD